MQRAPELTRRGTAQLQPAKFADGNPEYRSRIGDCWKGFTAPTRGSSPFRAITSGIPHERTFLRDCQTVAVLPNRQFLRVP